MKKGENEPGKEQGGIGRTRFLEEEQVADNSASMDQEEGRMNNGTIGRDWEDNNHEKNEEKDEREK